MPVITIDPTDVETIEHWKEVWQFATFSLNLTSAKVHGVPSTPAEYQDLLQDIANALALRTGGVITSYGGVLANVGVGKDLVAAVQAADPANVSSLAVSPLSDINTAGGSIGTVIATTATGSYSLVKKAVAITSALSILGTTIFAAQLSPANKQEIDEAVDDFVDENGNVTAYTNTNGTTFLPADFIEAIRQKLIELGAYEAGGEFTPLPSMDSNATWVHYFTSGSTESSTTGTITPQNYADYNKTALTFRSNFTLHTIRSNKPIYYTRFHYDRKNGVDATGDINLLGCDNIIRLTTASRNGVMFYIIKPLDGLTAVYGGEFYAVNEDTGVEGYAGSGDYHEDIYSFTYKGVTKSIKVFKRESIAGTVQQVSQLNDIPYLNDSTVKNDEFILLFSYLFGEQGEGVPGIGVQSDATVPSDPNQSLLDYFPEYFARKMTFKYLQRNSDGDITGVGDVDFLPATLKDVNGLNDDTTQTQTQAQTGTEPTDDIMEQLLEQIEEMYERIKNLPTQPTVPVDDSGDSPPASPPVISGAVNGLWSIYNPDLSDVQDFAAWLWSSNIVDQIVRMFNSPIDAVIGFHMIYCTPIEGTTQNIMCGYLDSGVSSPTVANQYVDLDCGSVRIPEYYGTVLDYHYTKIAIYLPFIGIMPLDTQICMGATLQVIYRIDVLTGACLAQIKVIRENSDAVMYAFPGNCAVQLPLTATTYTGMVGVLINGVEAGVSLGAGSIYGAIRHAVDAAIEGGSNLTGTRQSGALGANVGALGARKPYLIITHPVSYDAFEYNNQYGYPVNKTVTLGLLSGYTRVKNIHLSGIPCTDDELELIERLLKEGVIIN